MSSSTEQSAVPELARELREYERLLATLLQEPGDAALHGELSERFGRMQLQAQLLPGLTVTWTELLVSRADLLHALWSEAVPARGGAHVAACHARHRALIEQMVRACTRDTEQAAGRSPPQAA